MPVNYRGFRRPRRRRSKRKRRSRRRSKRKRRSNYGTTVIPRQILSNMTIVKIPYVTSYTGVLDFSSAWTFDHVFSAGSCWDPDVTGSGHQPYGFDQWAALYRTYTVLSCTCSTFTSLPNSPPANSITSSNNIVTAMSLQRSSQITDWQALTPDQTREHPGTVWRQLGHAGKASAALRFTYKAGRFWRVKTLTESDLEANTGSNPVNQAQFAIRIRDTNAVQTTRFSITIKLWYLVAFRHPLILPAS